MQCDEFEHEEKIKQGEKLVCLFHGILGILDCCDTFPKYRFHLGSLEPWYDCLDMQPEQNRDKWSRQKLESIHPLPCRSSDPTQLHRYSPRSIMSHPFESRRCESHLLQSILLDASGNFSDLILSFATQS